MGADDLDNYDKAREQFAEARHRERSAAARVRLWLAHNRLLRRTFDATYGRVYLRWFSSPRVRRRVAPYLAGYDGILFSPTGTGFSHTSELQMLADLGELGDVLLIGAEYGGEIDELWGPHHPRSVVGVDIGDYEQGWASRPAGNVPACFAKMDASHLGFAPRSFDLIYSQGVLPHIVDVPSFLSDAYDALRPGGIFYAFCCPLWRTFGGSHVHDLGYDHLRLSEADLLERAIALRDGTYWWLGKGLFNKLRFRDLLGHVEDRFDVIRVGVMEAPDGKRYRRTNPVDWAGLRQDHEEEDLLIRLVSLTARRPRTQPH
ncbi:MAG: class I SAM-dependent methyltransferase [Actinomycetota bacterium]|nr:class I SAM-dependent methyltransferase [Actinomycetota bacterium]